MYSPLQGHERGAPLLCLMSGSRDPLATGSSSSSISSSSSGSSGSSSSSSSRYGSMLSLALARPAQALCLLAGEGDPQPAALQRLQVGAGRWWGGGILGVGGGNRLWKAE